MTSILARAGDIAASLVSRHVRDSDHVLSGLPMRPGVPRASLPLFGEDYWDVTPVVFRENARRCHCSVDFAQLPDPAQRLTAKEYLYARLHEPAGSPRPCLAPASIRAVFNRLRRFMTFVESRRGQFRLDLLEQTDLDAWLAQLRVVGERGPHQVASLLDVPADLHLHADRLSQSGFTFTPWHGRPVSQVAGCPPVSRENSTPRIPEPVIAALLRWSLRYIDDFAPDILAARAALDQLEAHARKIDVHKTHGTVPVVTVVAKRLDTFLNERRAAGRGIPVWPDDARIFNTIDQVPINYALIGLHLGCNAGDISQTARNHARVLDAVRELGVETGGMEPPISTAVETGLPWRPHRLDQKSLPLEEKWLQAACYVVCAYLTGMRDSEVQAMRTGCHSVARSADGLIERHRISGTAYKHVGVTGRAEAWVTIAPVSRAVAVLECLTVPTRIRRGIDSLWVVLKNTAATKDHLSSEIVRTLNQFRDHLDRTRGEPGTPAIPRGADNQPWHFSTRQFRRTVAWHIANRPFGTVAGKIQYKHASIVTFEGYAGESRSGFRAEIAREHALGQLDDIVEHYEDFRRGLTPTGPASARILREFAHIRDELGDLPGRLADPARLRAMLRHLARTLHVGFLNDCFFDPVSALCLQRAPAEERRAPVLSRCSPDRCPNSCIASRHLPPWEASIADADEMLRDPRLSTLQRAALVTEQARKRRLIAPLQAAES
jgi:integrase